MKPLKFALGLSVLLLMSGAGAAADVKFAYRW